MDSNTKRNSLLKLSSLSIICAFLTACGSGGSDDSVDDTPSQSTGAILDSSNYQASFQTAGMDTARVLTNLSEAGDEINLDDLVNLGLVGSTATFACDNQGGTIQITEIATGTNEAVFTDCDIETSFSSTTYSGITTVNTVVHSGMASNIGNYLFDWDVTQTITMVNFSQTSPTSGDSESTTSNGEMVLESANNVASSLNTSTLKSTDLTIATTDTSGVLITRQFSNLYYDILNDNSDGENISEVDLDYTANITGLGDLTLTTDTELVTDTDDLLLSGSSTLSTGESVVKLVGTGNDNVEITIDVDNDGVFEGSLSTTWSILSGPE